MSKKTPIPLCHKVRGSLKRYFKDLNGEEPVNLHCMVISEVEKPLLEMVMERTQSNQTRAARMLGINRNTLRKKLKHYKLE